MIKSTKDMTVTKAAEAEAAQARVQAYLDRSGLARRGARVVPLTGDASDRRYFRVLVAEGPSTVLALHAGPIEYGALPFVNVAELLGRMPVPIPAILDHADDLGVLLLEDLGDVTLQAHLGAASPAEHIALYRQAVALIEVLQRRGAELQSPAFLPYAIAFDVEKLTWELEFFAKHFLQAYRGVDLTAGAHEALAEEFRTLVAELAAEPRVLCHRDYHSRNLMLHQERLYIIDFQDARMGPDTYDLVSLLRDSYVDLAEQTVDDLIAYFLALRGLTELEREFRGRFDLMALQRNLKALGTFGYQTTARRNPVYIQYIPRTLRYARDNLQRHARFGRLHEILAAHVEELR
jgi:aminoglycoside/choline kinase family phosphotransferase